MSKNKKVIAVLAALTAIGALGTAVANRESRPALHDSPQLNAQLAAQNVTLAPTIDRVDCAPAAVTAPKGKAGDDQSNETRGFKCDVHVAGQNTPVRWESYATDTTDPNYLPVTEASLAQMTFSASKNDNATRVTVYVKYPKLANTQEVATVIKVLFDQIGSAPAANSEAAQHAAQQAARDSAWDAKMKKNAASWSE